MARTEFLKLLKSKLYPVLRAEGFEGSGQTLRRIAEPVIHIFNVQGSSHGECCYLNMGAHLSFLPPEGGKAVDPDSFLEYHCIFRDRIDPPTGQAHGWAYGQTPQEAAEMVEFLVSEWRTQGQPFFQRYGTYPASFLKLLAEVAPAEIHPRNALHFARIAIHLGETDRAQYFARTAVAHTPETATYLLRDLNEILEKLGAG
jgi:hypothetical protein